MDLAYTMACGMRRFRWAAALTTQTLCGPGGFQGDVVILSDKPISGVPAQVRVIVDPLVNDLPRGNHLKMAIRHHVDLSAYDRVVMLDGDLVVRSPLTPFLDRCSETGGMVCCDDLGNTIRGGHCYRYLESDELEAHGDETGVNGGFFVAPGAPLADWLAEWEDVILANQHKPGAGYDQPGLNALMVRGRIPVSVIPRQMWFPKRDPDFAHAERDAMLVHFHGIGRHFNRYQRMRRFARQLMRGARS